MAGAHPRRASLEKLGAIENTFSSIAREELVKLEEVLPNKENVSDLIPNIEALVRMSDLTLGSVGVTPPESTAPLPPPEAGSVVRVPPGVRVIPVSLSVQGINYRTLKNVLQRIETNVRLLDMPTITFEAGSDAFSLTLYAYAYQPPQVVKQ